MKSDSLHLERVSGHIYFYFLNGLISSSCLHNTEVLTLAGTPLMHTLPTSLLRNSCSLLHQKEVTLNY